MIKKGDELLYIIRHDKDTSGGVIKCLYIGILKFRLLIALGSSNWYQKGKKRRIPIWISKEGLFMYRIALRIGPEPIRIEGDKHETS